jgi:hypothetical protein
MSARLLEGIGLTLLIGLLIWLEPGFVLLATLVSLPYLIFLIITDIEYMESLEKWSKENFAIHHHRK